MATEADRKQILVVEDDEPIAGLLKCRLESAGFQVRTAGDGKDALTCAAEQRPSLVILDLMLPDMDGFQVCRQIRKLSQPWRTPVLMLTAMDEPIDRLRGFAHGADAYLTKPFDADELVKTVGLLLAESALR